MRTAIVDHNNFGGPVTLFAVEAKDLNAGSTSGTTAQIVVITSLAPGDMVLPAGLRLDLPGNTTHAGTVVAKLGIVGDDDLFIASADIKTATVKARVPTVAADAVPYVNNTSAAINVVLTVTVGSGAISTLTTGDIWVCIPIIRWADRFINRKP